MRANICAVRIRPNLSAPHKLGQVHNKADGWTVSTTQEHACLAVTQVNHSACDLADRVQRQDWLVAQEEASHVELLKGQLSQLLPVCLHNRDF